MSTRRPKRTIHVVAWKRPDTDAPRTVDWFDSLLQADRQRSRLEPTYDVLCVPVQVEDHPDPDVLDRRIRRQLQSTR